MKRRKSKIVLLSLPVLALAAALALMVQIRTRMQPVFINTISDTALSQSAILKRLLSELDQHPLARKVTVRDNGNAGKGDHLVFRIQITVYDSRKHMLWLSSDGGSYQSRAYGEVSVDALRAASKITPANPYDLQPIGDDLEKHGCKRVIVPW